jgi:hypothetical protein
VSEGVRFPADSVLEHAVTVNDASERMDQARSAVGQVVMDSQAYGRLCEFSPGLLSPLFGNAVEVINDAVEALSETALKLRPPAGWASPGMPTGTTPPNNWRPSWASPRRRERSRTRWKVPDCWSVWSVASCET